MKPIFTAILFALSATAIAQPQKATFTGTSSFLGVGTNGNWWSSTEFTSVGAFSRLILYNYEYVYSNLNDKKNYLRSVRCLKDLDPPSKQISSSTQEKTR